MAQRFVYPASDIYTEINNWLDDLPLTSPLPSLTMGKVNDLNRAIRRCLAVTNPLVILQTKQDFPCETEDCFKK